MIKEYDYQYDTLVGKNIVLRKAKEDDYLSMLVNVWSNEEVYKWMLFTPTITPDAAVERVKLSIMFQGKNYCYFVALKSTNEAIGFCGIEEIEENTYRECGIAIGPKFQSKGYGKEVVGLLLDLAFNKLDGKLFVYGSFEDNTKSINLARYYGFHYYEAVTVFRKWDQVEYVINNYHLSKEDYCKRFKIKQKEIKTERLVLKSLSGKDQIDFIELLNDSLIKETYMLPDFDSHDKEITYFSRIKDLTNSFEHYSYGIFLDDKVIGFINDVSIDDLTIEVGYFISSCKWHQGYATEALKAVIDMLFRVGYERVEAGFFEGNERSKRVMEKSGMKLISKMN